jgi:transforming growth factor-beta-induced protein
VAATLVLAACGSDEKAGSTTTPVGATSGPGETTAAVETTAGAETTEAATETTGGEKAGTIVDVAVGAGDFTILVEAVKAAGLADTLSGPGPLTVFAPTDKAFADALTTLGITKEALFADKAKLTSILTYHVVTGKVMAADVLTMDGKDVPTVGGPPLKVKIDGSTVMINDATVTKADIEASNGVIHVIDKVLLPPS